MKRKIPSQILMIFGASGDLTRRKLVPALLHLFYRGLLPDTFLIIGVSRTRQDSEAFRLRLRTELTSVAGEIAPQTVDRFLQQVYYFPIETSQCDAYPELFDKVEELRRSAGIDNNILFYLATPPELYEVIPSCLKSCGQHQSPDGWRRIIVEKPFGRNEADARRIDRLLQKIFPEKEVYRIDHFLGKETVQNILVLRFANGIWEPLWNRNYIDRIEISATETLGVEERGKYYDTAGALRDMVQNHLMQLMAFVAMEPPSAFDTESIRDEIVKVFRALRPLTSRSVAQNVVRGQYTASEKGDMKGFRDEKDIAPDSLTETCIAMKFYIDNWRWGGVPFYFYTGKRLSEKRSEIIIHFRSTPQQLFKGECTGRSCNQLIITLQPDESIRLRFGLKQPGAGFTVRQVSMDFFYDSLDEERLPDAYERLLLDAMCGDPLLYARTDSLEASWHFLAPIFKYWEKAGEEDLYFYPAGSTGLQEIDRIGLIPYACSAPLCTPH